MSGKKKVTFHDPPTVIEEPVHLRDDLRKSRWNDILHRLADKNRLEMVLSPILEEAHRNRIYKSREHQPELPSPPPPAPKV